MANKYTKQDYQKRIDLLFPGWDYEILEYNGMKKYSKIKCLSCGKILEYEHADKVGRKVNVCDCYRRFKNYHDKMQYLSEKCGFDILEDEPQKKKKIRCQKCGCIMERSEICILLNPEHCDNCYKYREGKQHISKEEMQERLNQFSSSSYELLEYKGSNYRALLKHRECGYVFKIRCLSDLFNGRNRGCPNCYQFKSAGEQKIRAYLDKHCIDYVPQKTFSPLNKSKYRFDFFLPKYNLAIEYQGEQHYQETNFFRDNLETVQKRDEIKRKYCQDNGIELLEIKYTELQNIDAILSSRFND